ncbi:hypothetical protein FD51_GL000207 [Lacticaseibacillus zeae DSM 20178 = KCTC 3804]|uniref:Uncharacterized protein n=1 Tax=Lacticaseibacillus zeae DSM 20178 = KCTC 3804 TaxID=1423816 RepID=A0A0R1EWD7_LACZE|nr:hypothetical protein FD51_GL000207 [Lacticaseibacillus zeae DSM 20178 = KCTC 3804]
MAKMPKLCCAAEMSLIDTAAETRSQAQKSPHKDLKHKWPKPSLELSDAETRSQSQK